MKKDVRSMKLTMQLKSRSYDIILKAGCLANLHQFTNVANRKVFVLTDSGGLQEEAPALGKPVLVLRRETERPEAVAAGTVKLCGVEYDDVLRMGNELLRSREAYDAMAHAVNPYGDGHACARIADAILWHFGRRSERPADFNA